MEFRPTQRRAPVPVYLATTIVLFVFSLSAAESVGFVPCYVDGTECIRSSTNAFLARGPFDTSREVVALASLPELGPSAPSESLAAPSSKLEAILPERIVIPEIDLDLLIQNVESRDIDVLYEELKSGPIRYVDSAKLGEQGNILIFGHSSRLPVVKNQMYKAFNRISELEAGDVIRVSGDGREYLYSVESVEQVDIEDPTSVISLAKEGKRLTLVTCDTLTGKSARFVLTAELVGTY
ncbi:sortase [Candidatus Kaiserbacteria bacterium]|nr:sortase [Candidatus Kaiserbacteria bacterium]